MGSRIALSPAMRKHRQPLGQWVQRAPPRGQCFDLERLTSDLSLTLGSAVSRSASTGAPTSASQLLVPRRGIDMGFPGVQNDFAQSMAGACFNNMVFTWRHPAAVAQEMPAESRGSSADTTSTTGSSSSSADLPNTCGGAGLHQAGAVGQWRKVTPVRLMPEAMFRTSGQYEAQDPTPRRCRSTGPAKRSRESMPAAAQDGRLFVPKKVTFDNSVKPASPMSLMSLCQTPDVLPPVSKNGPGRSGSSRRRCSSAAALLEPRMDSSGEEL